MRRTPSAATILDEALGPPPDQRTIAEQVAERLRELIIDGTLPPGTPLRVNPLAERLGMSAMPVRDALKLLEVERLVESTPRRGAVVSGLSEEDIEEIYGMRAALEGICARHGTERATEADRAELVELFTAIERAQQADDLDAFKAADRAFHDRLYGLCGRERILRTVGELHARSRRYQRTAYLRWRPLGDAVEEHRRILEAVLARDGHRAEQLTRAHLDGAAGRLLAAVREQGSLLGG
jgi:DNA-binding GntR family transcriptional regulator